MDLYLESCIRSCEVLVFARPHGLDRVLGIVFEAAQLGVWIGVDSLELCILKALRDLIMLMLWLSFWFWRSWLFERACCFCLPRCSVLDLLMMDCINVKHLKASQDGYHLF